MGWNTQPSWTWLSNSLVPSYGLTWWFLSWYNIIMQISNDRHWWLHFYNTELTICRVILLELVGAGLAAFRLLAAIHSVMLFLCILLHEHVTAIYSVWELKPMGCYFKSLIYAIGVWETIYFILILSTTF